MFGSPQVSVLGSLCSFSAAFCDQVTKRDDDLGKLVDEAPVVAGEPKEAAEFSGGSGYRPVSYSFNLSRLAADPVCRDSVVKVVDLWADEPALVQPKFEAGLDNALKEMIKVLQVVLKSLGVD